MKLILSNFSNQNMPLLKELAKVLNFQISKLESGSPEKNKMLFAEMEQGKNSGLLSKAARQDFENTLLKK